MALLWMDGFEGFSSTGTKDALNEVYSFPSASTQGADVGLFTPGRTGGKAIYNVEGASYVPGSNPEIYTKEFGSAISTDATWIIGCAVRINYERTYGTDFLQFWDSNPTSQFTVQYRSGTFLVRDGNGGGTILGHAAVSVPTSNWYYFEIKIFFHDTNGTITLRVNNEEVLALTSLDTITTGTSEAYITTVGFCGSNASMRMEFDDLYVCDGSGGVNDDFLGDGAIRKIVPNGDGNRNEFLGSDGDAISNYAMVDEDDPDGDTTYVVDSVIGQTELYALGNLADTPSSISAVSVVNYARSTTTPIDVAHIIRSSTTETTSPYQVSWTSYQHDYAFWDEDPDTSAAWTESTVNALESGIQIV